MKFKLVSFIALILLFSIFNLIVACSSVGTTKPNTPYKGLYPDKFNQILESNSLLANEIMKLPELRDGISESEAKAITQIYNLYFENSRNFDRTFNEMFTIGLPEVRKYCSPLQALFWCAEDGKIELAKEIIQNYNLEKLIKNTWKSRFSIEHSFNIPKEEVIFIATNCINDVDIGPMLQSRKRNYLFSLNLFHNEKDGNRKKTIINNIRDQIHLDYMINKKRFSKKGLKIIEKNLNRGPSNQRWKDYKTVIERLNGPELIDYYAKNEIEYEKHFGYKRYAKNVFKDGRGNCVDISMFVTHCLNKSGYSSTVEIVDDLVYGPCSHLASFYKNNGNYYIIDGAKETGILGPFESMDQGPYKLCKSKRFHPFNK